MAGSVLGLVLTVAVSVLLLAQQGDANDFKVGDSMYWEVPPSDSTELYNNWAQKNRFSVGDSLVFTYDAGKDSVLQVDEKAYHNCQTDSYIQSFKDGHTVVKLNHSGPFYFISGNEEHCKKNQKLVVVVLSERRVPSSPSSQPAPAPTSSEVPSSSSSPPSPSPSGASSPSGSSDMVPSSPPGSSDMVPSSPPDQSDDAAHTKKKNGAAASVMLGALGSFGALFIGSLHVLVL